jgi:hypothetical protein
VSQSSQSNQLEVWLEGFPKEETEAQIRELERELTSLRNALALHESFAKPNGDAPDEDSPTEPASRPDAIRRVLRERGNEPATSGEVRHALLDRGWLTKDQLNLYYAAMSTMTKRKHLLRLQDGRYVLPPGRSGGDMS